MNDTTASGFNGAISELFDNIGAYTIPPKNGDPIIADRKMGEYCKDRGIDPISLTDKDRKMFIIGYW